MCRSGFWAQALWCPAGNAGPPLCLCLPLCAASAHAGDLHLERFEPSKQLDKPYVMVGCNVIVADRKRAKALPSPQRTSPLVRGTRGQLPPPIDDIEAFWSPAEKHHAAGMLACSFHGTKDSIKDKLAPMIEETGADEPWSPPPSGITGVYTLSNCWRKRWPRRTPASYHTTSFRLILT